MVLNQRPIACVLSGVKVLWMAL